MSGPEWPWGVPDLQGASSSPELTQMDTTTLVPLQLSSPQLLSDPCFGIDLTKLCLPSSVGGEMPLKKRATGANSLKSWLWRNG